MSRYKALLCYDGTGYFGWQKTRMGPSVQETLERALFQIAREQVVPEAASRTDRGVHAEGQMVSFALANSWEPRRLHRSLNGVLPEAIRVLDLEEVEDSFHPTLDARGKEYRYFVCLGAVQEPLYRHYSWHYPFALDINAMRGAAQQLLGSRDFSALANRIEKNPICTLTSLTVEPLENGRFAIAIRGDRFLYKMARNIAGTLLYVGSGKLPAASIPVILASLKRTQAGVTAPAHGLFLHRVFYNESVY